MADFQESDTSDIPPLEDMTEEINRRFKVNNSNSNVKHSYLEAEDDMLLERKRHDKIKEMLSGGESKDSNNYAEANKGSKDSNIRQAANNTKSTTSKEETFCGFKKGFLLQNNEKKKVKPIKKSKDNEIIEVKKNKKADVSKNVLPEVQNAMKEQIPSVLNSKDWVTPDLLDEIMKNPKLSKHFNDPNFNEAITLFQTNPQKVMQMCKENAEMREFIMEFSNLMGNHFSKLGEQQAKAGYKNSNTSSEDEKKISEVLKDDEMKQILQKPDVQKLLFLLKTDPEKARRFLQSADATMRGDIQRLIDAGLLHFGAG